MAEAKKNDPGVVTIKDVRLSFEHLWQAQRQKNEDGEEVESYSCNLLIPKATPEGKKIVAALKAAAEEVKKAKYGTQIPKYKSEKVFLRDGDNESYDGYAGMVYVSTRSPEQPKLIDRDKSPLTKSAGKIYSGCYVNAVIRIWCQDNKHGKRVNAEIKIVQFLRHGEAFGNRPLNPDDYLDDETGNFADDVGDDGDVDDVDSLI